MSSLLPLLLVVGCGPFRVVKQAVPNPLVNQRRFGLEPLQYDKVVVNDVKLPRAPREPTAQDAPPDKERPELRALQSQFATRLEAERKLRLVPPVTGEKFVVRPVLLDVTPGGIGHIETTAHLRLSILSGETVLDEVILDATVLAALRREPEERVAMTGRLLAEATLDYLRSRTGATADRPPPPPPPPKKATPRPVEAKGPGPIEPTTPPSLPGVHTAISLSGRHSDPERQRRCDEQIRRTGAVRDLAGPVQARMVLGNNGANRLVILRGETVLSDEMLPGWGMEPLCWYALNRIRTAP